ncbi:hypothetical protein FRC17_009269 [Serendipita sp. 399]|nr:hypothetical protein FRC17_009269 [Serendipita sp. 399]
MDADPKRLFATLKSICVPLLKNARLTPETTPNAASLLADLLQVLQSVPDPRVALPEGLVHYIFFPISGIIRQNNPTTIPDHVMERILNVMTILLQSWWWTIESATRTTLLSVASRCLPSGDRDSDDTAKQYDEDTQLAAVRCIWEILRDHSTDDGTTEEEKILAAQQISKARAISPPQLVAILSSLLLTTTSANFELQIVALKCIRSLMDTYCGEDLTPTVMPGVISSLSRLLSKRTGRSQPRGELVRESLRAIQTVIVLGIGDDVCAREGAIRIIGTLDDFGDITTVPPSSSRHPELVQRTPSWLNATSTQLHNALNTMIPPLINHPTAAASEGLIDFCSVVLSATSETLQRSQTLLVLPLLILMLHPIPSIATRSRQKMVEILTNSNAKTSVLEALKKLTNSTISNLPQLLLSSQIERLESGVKVLTAVSILSAHGVSVISKSISHVLGPNGGIEKWGWNLLEGLELGKPSVFHAAPDYDVLLLQNGPSDRIAFPGLQMKHIQDSDTQQALATFFRSWGAAAGDDALFSVEWFVKYASNGSNTTEVSALWCAARLLEGICGHTLGDNQDTRIIVRSVRLKQHAKWLSKLISLFWEQDGDEDEGAENPPNEEGDNHQIIEYVKGIQQLDKLLDWGKKAKQTNEASLREQQKLLHRAQSLHLLALSSSILETRFSATLLQSLYPILHSFVSTDSFLSATSHSTLLHVSQASGYASPANLLLSNFDYALGSVSRHLTRQRLDMHAPKVLVILVRLVGKSIVERAGDVVEECFDRLDDYHGYRVIVEGLIEVLLEVVKVLEQESTPAPVRDASRLDHLAKERYRKPRDDLSEFCTWLENMKRPVIVEEKEDFGPVPRRAWGQEGKQEENGAEPEPEGKEAKLSPNQVLVQQIVDKAVYFLTHSSPLIRARILSVLTFSIATLSEIKSSLLPSIHTAWPFILNRFKDSEPFVVTEAAELITALVEHVGDFMDIKVWDDIWPIFRRLISNLETSDKQYALTRRDHLGVPWTSSAYTTSHRLYRSILRTTTLAVAELVAKDNVFWEILLTCRRFLSKHFHEEVQKLARNLYTEAAIKNADAVWLALKGAMNESLPFLSFSDDIRQNAEMIFTSIDGELGERVSGK